MKRRKYEVSYTSYRRVSRGATNDGAGDVVKIMNKHKTILEGLISFGRMQSASSWFKQQLDRTLPNDQWVLVTKVQPLDEGIKS